MIDKRGKGTSEKERRREGVCRRKEEGGGIGSGRGRLGRRDIKR